MTFVEAAEAGDAPDAGDAAPNKAALLRSWNPNSDPELEELPRDTPKPGTPPVRSPTPERPLTPGAARIKVEASMNQQRIWKLLLIDCKLLLRDYSSDSSNPRTPVQI